MTAMAEHDEILRFEGVSKTFGDHVIYENLDLAIRRGEVLTVLGRSGTGKSVMLRMMLGLLPADAGSIVFEGEDIVGKDEVALLPVRRAIGMVFQNSALFDSLTVFENIAYPLVERGQTDEETLRARVEEVLAMVDLPGIEDMLPADLSGGMRKRVALARAVAESPSLMLYDEPTTGLDPPNVRRICDLILSLRASLSLSSVVVTHDLPSAYRVSDRLALIADYRVALIDDVEPFRASTLPEVQSFLHAMDIDQPGEAVCRCRRGRTISAPASSCSSAWC